MAWSKLHVSSLLFWNIHDYEYYYLFACLCVYLFIDRNMSYRSTHAQSVDSSAYEQSRTIQDLTALVREQSTQIHHLLNLQNTKHSSPQPRQLTPQATYERFLKLHATEFHGGLDPTIAEEWVKYLEVIFEYLEMSDRDIIYCALFLMKNEARHWWEGTKTGVELANTTWETFKTLFFVFLQKCSSPETKIVARFESWRIISHRVCPTIRTRKSLHTIHR